MFSPSSILLLPLLSALNKKEREESEELRKWRKGKRRCIPNNTKLSITLFLDQRLMMRGPKKPRTQTLTESLISQDHSRPEHSIKSKDNEREAISSLRQESISLKKIHVHCPEKNETEPRIIGAQGP
jgi:hypothetical protein